jgi:hypothetical protein
MHNNDTISEEEQKIITSLVNNEYRTKYLKKDILRLQEFLELIDKTLKSQKLQKIDSKDEELIKINEKLIDILYKHRSGDHDIKYQYVSKIFFDDELSFCQKLLKKIIRSIYGAVINQKILDTQKKEALYRCCYAVTSKKLENFLEKGYINGFCREVSRKNFHVAHELFHIARDIKNIYKKIEIYNEALNMMKKREDKVFNEACEQNLYLAIKAKEKIEQKFKKTTK